MKNRLKYLIGVYALPIILMIFIPTVKEIQVNGHDAGLVWAAFAGFFIGVAIEGVLLIMALTIFVLTGMVDEEL